jgi:L-rhamnose mutarotase
MSSETNLSTPKEGRPNRAAFLLRLRPGVSDAYEEAHRQVWPEMLDLLSRSGVSDYSIFRRDESLFLIMTVEDFEATWDRIEADPINTRWQKSMEPYFAELPTLRPGERLPMLTEIFHMP